MHELLPSYGGALHSTDRGHVAPILDIVLDGEPTSFCLGRKFIRDFYLDLHNYNVAQSADISRSDIRVKCDTLLITRMSALTTAPIRVRFLLDKSYGSYEYKNEDALYSRSGGDGRDNLGYPSPLDEGKEDSNTSNEDVRQGQGSPLGRRGCRGNSKIQSAPLLGQRRSQEAQETGQLK
jgi:hypothetical protein